MLRFAFLLSSAFALAMLPAANAAAETQAAPQSQCVTATRLLDQPVIHPALDASITDNIQGPSLIKVPDWVEGRLGQYYLYFASHQGNTIRMAYAGDLRGPWTVYQGGVLPLEQSYFPTSFSNVPDEFKGRDGFEAHIASPDVHIDEENRRFVLYYHGQTALREQSTRVALSSDGLSFEARPEEITPAYLRAFTHDGQTYGMAMPGIFYRSKDGLSNFERGPTLFENDQRHSAMLKQGNQLFVFWTRAGDAPERIYVSRIGIDKPWAEWQASTAEEVLRPQLEWEGLNAPVSASKRGTAYGYQHQLRDPAIYEEDGKIYLLYAGAGESGIGLASLHIDAANCR